MMKVLLNNRIKDLKKTDLDTGYFYGYGLFETILIREGEAVLLEEHLTRLNKGLEQIGINRQITIEEVEYAITALRLYNVALKINVSEANVIYSTRALTYTAEHYQKGISLKVSDVLRNPTSPTVGLKSMNYMDNIIEMQKAKAEGFNDVLFLNPAGEVCETAVANIFVIKDGILKTPALDCGLLNGVIRQWLCERFEVDEVVLSLEDLMQADGVFATNSLMGLMKVTAIEGRELKESDMVRDMTGAYVTFLKKAGE